MTLQTKTLDEMIAIVKGALRGHIDGADVATGRDYDVSARMVAAGVMLNQQQALENAKQILPTSADGDMIDRHLAAKGLSRRLAAKALGKVQLVSTAGNAQAQFSELVHADGTKFKTRFSSTPTLPAWSGKTIAGGTTPGRLVANPDTTNFAVDKVAKIGSHYRAIKEIIGGTTAALDLYEPLPSVPSTGTSIESTTYGSVVEIECDVVGAIGNKSVGDILTLTSPATGITAECRILELGGGGDDETNDEAKARTADTWAQHPSGGNQEYIRTRARQTPNIRIADAIVYPGLRGLGTTDVIPMGVAGARRVGAVVAGLIDAELARWLSPHEDVLVAPLTYASVDTDVDVTVTTGIGFERDFIHSGFSIAASPASTVSRIYVTTSPEIVPRGARVLVQLFIAGWWDVFECEVTDRVSASPNFWLDVRRTDTLGPLPAIPTTTDPVVLPGGPLSTPAIAAWKALFDSLGPSRKVPSAAFSYERHPDPSIAFDDTVRRTSISAALQEIPGVVGAAVTTPVADSQPDAPQVARRGKFHLRFLEL